MQPAIEVSRLTKRYDKFVAVDGVEFQVFPGEVFGLLGPNGAGKTTTLKMLAGVLAPNEGSVRVAGVDTVAHPQLAKRQIGYLPQDLYAYEKLTGREFLHFIAEVRGIPIAQRAPLFKYWIERFNMETDADKLIEGYSGGMTKKLLLIATFLHDPPVLMLDEPTISLDPFTVRKVRTYLQNRARKGHAVLLSTHVLEIAEKMCDRIAIIYKGRICALGTMEELRAAWLEDGQGNLEDIFIAATGVEVDDFDILEHIDEPFDDEADELLAEESVNKDQSTGVRKK